jgi:hypothetical protein
MSEPLDVWCDQCGFGDHKNDGCQFRKSELASAPGSAVLFLDIDGVLNYVGGPTECGMYGLDHDKVSLLEKIIDATQCRIVLSSTWRKFGKCIAKVERMLDSIGYELHDMTPVLDGLTSGAWGSPIWTGASRGREIQAWLDKHPSERFVILDDDTDMGALLPHLVNTDIFVGLTPDLADEVIRRLNNTAKPCQD